jgi:UDP-glucose 4-epimerase
MRILVTGGAGFIGSHLIEELLKKKYKVITIDNLVTGNLHNLNYSINSIIFKKVDITDFKNLKKIFNYKIDAIIHLAALADIVPSIENPDKYFNTNVIGTHNLLLLAKINKIKKFIYAASSTCYGIPNSFPTKENSNIDTKYPYALTKNIAEQMVVHFGKVYKLPFISLRLFNVYGPRVRTSGTYGAVFGVFMTQKLNNKPLTVVGNGRQRRDFTYVKDVALAFIKAIETNISNEIFNIGSGKPVSINFVVKILKHKYIFIPKRPGEPDCTHADIKKAKYFLKWKPTTNIHKGIKLMEKDILFWKTSPVWTKDKIKKATKTWFKFLK